MAHLLPFTVAGVACALPLADVQQVTGMVELRPMTGGRDVGAVNLHGRIIPVYSLRRRLGLPDRPPHPDDALIIARAGRDCAALWVDAVERVRVSTTPLPREGEPSPLPGVLLTEEGMALIYDLPLFLAAEERAPLPRPPDTDGGEPPREPGRARTILADRARALMQRKEEPRETPFPELLTFRLAGREYAVGMQYIREVFILREITPVPGVPDFIAGIGAVRGEIISVVDLCALFSIPKHGLTDLNRVIVLSDGAVTFGILADYITDIGTRPTDHLAPVDPGMTPIDRRYLVGVTDESVIVLDAAALLASPGMVIDEARK